MKERITVFEVGPRDGLQNEPRLLSLSDKQALIGALFAAGIRHIEATSFVSPKVVPQMADADSLLPSLSAPSDARLYAAAMNERGLERALAAGATALSVVLPASDTLAQRNARMSLAQGLEVCNRMIMRARQAGTRVRAYIAAAWVCPYEGPTDPERVIALAERLWSARPDEIVLADTIGHAHPLEVGRLCDRVGARIGIDRLAVHLHDTLALGLANAAAAIAAGVRTVDASIAGLGGCPFAPGAAGNLATEDLVLMAHKMGFTTGVDLDLLWSVVARVETLVGRPVGGRTRAFREASRTKGAAP
jgi:hydroxymethylglutaryl-CoA lyase